MPWRWGNKVKGRKGQSDFGISSINLGYQRQFQIVKDFIGRRIG